MPFIRAAADAEKDISGELLAADRRLTVFPGLELTLAVPCQALLILDADFPTDRLATVLEVLGIEPIDPALERLPPVVRLEHIHTFEKLHEDLDLRPWLKGRYAVFPNVTDGGYQTLMRSGMQAKYRNMPCVGGYLDGTVATKAKPGSGNHASSTGSSRPGEISASLSFKPPTHDPAHSLISASTRLG